MRLLGVILVLVLCVCRGAAGVQVKAGDRSFPLEAVKQLEELVELDSNNNSPHLAEMSVAAVCMNPVLPQIFQQVCQEKRAGIIMSQLVDALRSPDPCEICINPACYGC